ncbi:pyocin knob domain-containing protein [Anaerosporobacter sp.]|uniref:pyocin knob domain-containing protein n=1 Tax=Anaerosporobacter sp. TaxID=1872529 RepID=UPI00286F2935|nr:pyocin knob domain-containing protein [Anaerosporobacter sp.]
MKSVIKTMKNRIKDTIYYPRTLVEAIVSLKENKSLQNILDDKIDKNKISHDMVTTNTDMVLGADVGAVMAQEINSLNNNLTTIKGIFIDCNNPTATICVCNSNTLNTPYKQGLTAYSQGMCISVMNNNDSYNTQLFIVSGTSVMYIRSKNVGIWSNWSLSNDLESLTVSSGTISMNGDLTGIGTQVYLRYGKLVVLSMCFKATKEISANTVIADLPLQYVAGAGNTGVVTEKGNYFTTTYKDNKLVASIDIASGDMVKLSLFYVTK